MGEPRYEMLMSSLPYHGRLFGARQTPISRFQLNKRLAWLSDDDADTLANIESILQWRRQLLDQSDTEFLRQAAEVLGSLDNPLLQEVVRSRLEIRTLIAAVRMRNLGQPAPRQRGPFGYGRWVDVMRRHWAEPDFGLTRVYPWAVEADTKFRERDALGLEKLIMGHLWAELSRFGFGHYFDFEAVAIYVLRWDLIDRWTHYNEADATANILQLADDGLGGYAGVYH